jgi:hypothetical protein
MAKGAQAMQTIESNSHYSVSERGAALFMALIFLLVMTILGVFGMNVSRMENLMAGNNQFQTTALSNAELMISEGEQKVRATLGTFLDWNLNTDHFYDRTASSTQEISPQDINWAFKFGVPGGDTHEDGDGDFPSRFVVEYAGPEVIPGNSEEITDTNSCISGACVWVFLVTAQNETSRGAKRTVQTVYVTGTPP